MPGATNCWKSTSLQMKMSVYDEEECFILFCFHSFDLLLNTDFFSCITAIIFMITIKVRLYFAAVRNVLNCLIIEECFFVIPLKKKKLSFFLFFLSNVYIGFGGDMNSSSQPAGILLDLNNELGCCWEVCN